MVVVVDLFANLLRINCCLVIVAISYRRIGKSIVRVVARVGQRVNYLLIHLIKTAIKADQTKAKRVVKHHQRCHQSFQILLLGCLFAVKVVQTYQSSTLHRILVFAVARASPIHLILQIMACSDQ